MKKNSRWIIITGLIVAALLVPRLLLTENPEKASKGKAGAGTAKRPVSVTAAVVMPERLEDRFDVSGTLSSDDAVELKAEAAGRVVEIAFKEGSLVRKGDLLVRLNDEDLQAQLAKADATLKLADAKEKRSKTLLTQAMISQEAYDNALRELSAAQADVSLYKAQIAKSSIRAPFDGRIGLREVSPGAYLLAGTRVAVMVGIGGLRVEFAVPERYAGKIRDGLEVFFTPQSGSERYEARVYAGDPAVDPATRTVRFRARCLKSGAGLFSGASVRVEIPMSENNSALMVPSESILPDASGPRVFVLKGGEARAAAVTVGVRGSEKVEITSGLSAGDTIAVMGVQALKDGSKVEIRAIVSTGSTTANSPNR